MPTHIPSRHKALHSSLLIFAFILSANSFNFTSQALWAQEIPLEELRDQFKADENAIIEKYKNQANQPGTDVNTAYPYYYGKTALMHAVDNGEQAIALYLLEQGADPDVVIPMDPLTVAEANGYGRAADKIRELRK